MGNFGMCTGQNEGAIFPAIFMLLCKQEFPEEKAHINSFIPTTDSIVSRFREEWLRG